LLSESEAAKAGEREPERGGTSDPHEGSAGRTADENRHGRPP
jgi:hypothetical protein